MAGTAAGGGDGIGDATRRAGLVWVQPVGSATARPVWHRWHAGRAYVLTGGSEQPPPGTQTGRALVVVPGGQDERALQWWADVVVVEPGSQEWEEVAPLLSAGRLNARDVEHQRARWARECVLLRFTPDGGLLEPHADGYLAPPLPTPATTEHASTGHPRE